MGAPPPAHRPPRAQQPDKPDTRPLYRECAYCGHRGAPDTRGYCRTCGATMARAAWPPPSQEARAAAHGITRTRATSDPKCALCQDDHVVNYPGEGRDACPNCSGGSRR